MVHEEQHAPAASEGPSGPRTGAPGRRTTPAYYGGAWYGDPYGAAPLYGEEPEPTGFFGQLSLRRLLMVLRRKWKLVAATALFGLIASYYVIWTTTPIYEAGSTIEVLLRRPRILAQRDAVIDDSGYDYTGKAFNTQLQKLKGKALRAVALETFEASNPELDASVKEAFSAARIDFRPVSNSRLVRAVVQHQDPALAATLADVYGHAAVTWALDANQKASDNAVAWLESQASTRRDALELADGVLLEFREKNNVEALRNQKQTVQQALLAFNESLVGAEREVELLRDLVKELSRVAVTPEVAGRLPSSIPRAAEIAQIYEQFRRQLAERDNMLTRYTENHPKVIEQEQLLGNLRAQLVDASGRGRSTAERNLTLLEEQAESLREKKKEQEELASAIELNIVRTTMELNALEREQEAADISYRGILKRIEEARLAADEKTATVVFQEAATTPRTPIRPRKGRIQTFGLLLGLLGGFALALVSDRLEDHIWSSADVEQGLGLKILGLVPHVKDTERADLALTCARNRFSRVAESFAGIRGFLSTEQYRDLSKVLLVVSAAPEEGKTIFSTNLAATYALSGKRTLLIDMDLRRPRMRKIFHLNGKNSGLMEVLAGKDHEALAQLPEKTEVPDLDVIISHPQEDLSPAELLGGPLVAELVTWARKTYDCVIIDSPPLGAVSDSVVLGSLVDGVIIMCRPMRSRKHPTRMAVRHLSDAGANILGVVMNDVDLTDRGYGRYYHGADYYPHYGHYSQRDDVETAPAERTT